MTAPSNLCRTDSVAMPALPVATLPYVPVLHLTKFFNTLPSQVLLNFNTHSYRTRQKPLPRYLQL